MGEESANEHSSSEAALVQKNGAGDYSPVKQQMVDGGESAGLDRTESQKTIANEVCPKRMELPKGGSTTDTSCSSAPPPSTTTTALTVKLHPEDRQNEFDDKTDDDRPLIAGGQQQQLQPQRNGSVVFAPMTRDSRLELADSGYRQTDLEGNDDDQDYDLVPPDGGWGWLVLLGSMLVNILVPGTIKSFGVLFVEFLEAFQASPSTAAWIPALCYFLYSSLGPLSSILSVKYSYRTVTIVGGTFAAVGMIITYWATSVNYLYVSYGVLVGTGAGLSFPPTVYIVTSYFVKLRGLANGLCISGSALGSIILPPVLRYLLENFGYRGACLIMGGITLNVWVAAIFYEPVENHMKRVPKAKELREITSNGANNAAGGAGVGDASTIMEEPETYENGGDATSATANGKDRPSKKPKFAITGDDTPVSTPTMEHKSPDIFRFNPKNGLIDSFARSASAAAVPMSYTSGREETATNRQRKISTPIKEEHRNLTFTSQLSSTSYFNNDTLGSHFRLNRLNSGRSGPKAPKRSPSTSSFQYVSTPYHGSTLSALQPREFASHLSLKSFTGSLNPAASRTKTVDEKSSASEASGAKKFFDLSLLSDPTYLVILISNSTNAIGYTNFIILLPAYAISLGFDKSLAAYLLSIVSTLDLVGRIGGSALSDTNLIPKPWYFVGGLSISGLALALLPLATEYTTVSIFCGLFGLASGTYVGITAVIMADMLGTERLTSSYGISLFVNGILQLIGPPICGVIFERMGQYQPLFTALGFILLGGSALWGFMPFIRRHKRRQQAKLEAAQQEAEKSLIA